MRFLWDYIKPFKRLVFVTLFLATINQVFSLLDPQIFRRIIDIYITRMDQLSREEFIYGVLLHLGALITVAMISRLAKNFQDYFLNVISQKAGMQLYQQSLRQIFALPYKVFEDQKSGQLLQKLHQARTNFQTFLRLLIDVVFLSFVGLSFVITYAYIVHWLIGFLYTLLVPIMAFTMYIMSRKIKVAQSRIVKESSDLAGETTETVRNVSLIKSLGLQEQEMDRLEDTNVRIL
jgi:ATP-binding cassette subfamily B protein